MPIAILPASLADKPVLRNLLELYAYDFRGFDQSDVDAHGLFGYNHLDHYWTESGRYSFWVKVEGQLAGLVLVRTLAESDARLTYSGSGPNGGQSARPGLWAEGYFQVYPGRFPGALAG